jgi:polyisoprenoid-binding protein YceI
MKKTAILASLAAALVFSAFTSKTTTVTKTQATKEVAAPERGRAYKVDLDKSNVKWHAKKVTGEHFGNINVADGQMLIEKNKLVGGTFTIDMNTITSTDLKDPGYNKKLITHLKSDDFFSVEKHPTATFTITKATPIAKAAAGQPNYNIEGNLTIKGNTNPISFPAIVTIKNGVATAKADVVVNRAKYDVRYGSNSFFEGLGDKAIYDDFNVAFDVTAKQ